MPTTTTLPQVVFYFDHGNDEEVAERLNALVDAKLKQGYVIAASATKREFHPAKRVMERQVEMVFELAKPDGGDIERDDSNVVQFYPQA